MSDYNAYVHARPGTVDALGIFYVGKGSTNRARNVVGRNSHHSNIVRKYGRESVLVGNLPCSSEGTAFELERGLIKCLRHMGVELVNLTDGGEGPLGRITSAQTKEKLSAALRGKPIGRKGVPRGPMSQETKDKLSAIAQGRRNSPQAIIKMSEAAKVRWASVDERNKQAARTKAWYKRSES